MIMIIIIMIIITTTITATTSAAAAAADDDFTTTVASTTTIITNSFTTTTMINIFRILNTLSNVMYINIFAQHFYQKSFIQNSSRNALIQYVFVTLIREKTTTHWQYFTKLTIYL